MEAVRLPCNGDFVKRLIFCKKLKREADADPPVHVPSKMQLLRSENREGIRPARVLAAWQPEAGCFSSAGWFPEGRAEQVNLKRT